jgi:flagellar hook-length control protein FliK
MVIKVTPDSLGPVTVQAHISGSDVRIELFAPNDAGRDALRGILQDLKRDIAGSGLQAQLNLSSGNHPGSQQGDGGRSAFNQRGFGPNAGATNSRQLPMDTPEQLTRTVLSGTNAVLDVMA